MEVVAPGAFAMGNAMDVAAMRRHSGPDSTSAGTLSLSRFTNGRDDKEHLALVMGDVTDGKADLVRVHSECMTGDVFGSLRCDCASGCMPLCGTHCCRGPRRHRLPAPGRNAGSAGPEAPHICNLQSQRLQ